MRGQVASIRHLASLGFRNQPARPIRCSGRRRRRLLPRGPAPLVGQRVGECVGVLVRSGQQLRVTLHPDERFHPLPELIECRSGIIGRRGSETDVIVVNAIQVVVGRQVDPDSVQALLHSRERSGSRGSPWYSFAAQVARHRQPLGGLRSPGDGDREADRPGPIPEYAFTHACTAMPRACASSTISCKASKSGCPVGTQDVVRAAERYSASPRPRT